MRHFCRIVLVSVFFQLTIAVLPAIAGLADSLRKNLDLSHDSQNQISLLLNLTDISASTPEEELPYCIQLYEVAYDAGDKFALAAALPSVVLCYIDQADGAESLAPYFEGTENLLADSEYDGIVTYYRMTSRARELQMAAREDKAAICERLMAFYEQRRQNENCYERAERLFMSGVVAYQLLALSSSRAAVAGLPYWEELWAGMQNFNPTVRRLFAGNTVSCMLLAYIEQSDGEKLIGISDAYLALLDTCFSDAEFKSCRPYYSAEASYLLCYQILISGGNLIGQERAHEYYLHYREFIRKDNYSDVLLHDKTFYYVLSRIHYDSRGEYDKALGYCDSLIAYQETGQGVRSASLLAEYRAKAGLLRKSGRYSEACQTYECFIKLSDSLSLAQYRDKVSDMEARFGMEKLEAAMEADRRRNLLVLAWGGLLITAAVGVYFYYSLYRERRLKNELRRQNVLANESDCIKTAFLNMAGHEVRTPLNVIGGFVEVLLSGECSESQRTEYLNIVREHTQMLTSLTVDMLEVTNLDSYARELPREPLCLNDLFRNIVAQTLRGNHSGQNTYVLELPDEEVIVKTHAGYFSHAVRELIKNASKFTARGEIILSCSVNQRAGVVKCMVSDTGIGIPVDKAEYIFERFTQLDSFVQGAGLGLCLCRMIVNKLHGSVWLDTSYTKGARFVITMPLDW